MDREKERGRNVCLKLTENERCLFPNLCHNSDSDGGEIPWREENTKCCFLSFSTGHWAKLWSSCSPFEYWFNCLFLWQTHASHTVTVEGNMGDIVSTLRPGHYRHSDLRTPMSPVFLPVIFSYHRQNVSLWRCIKTKRCIRAGEREKGRQRGLNGSLYVVSIALRFHQSHWWCWTL